MERLFLASVQSCFSSSPSCIGSSGGRFVISNVIVAFVRDLVWSCH